MMILAVNSTLTVMASAIVFLALTLFLVIILLLARHYLVATGKVKISINDGKKEIEIESGKSLLNSLHEGADSARFRCLKAVATSCPPRQCTSHARSSKTTGAWDARLK